MNNQEDDFTVSDYLYAFGTVVFCAMGFAVVLLLMVLLIAKLV